MEKCLASRRTPSPAIGKRGGRSNDGAPGGSEPRGQELEYAARITLDGTHMQVENKLSTVETKTSAPGNQLASLAAGEIQAGSSARAVDEAEAPSMSIEMEAEHGE
jgi:hypothetical protein